MNEDRDKQTINSLNNYDVPAKVQKTPKDYQEKYNLDPKLTNKYCAWVANPTVQPDSKTEMNVPIPSIDNVEFSKEYQEENKL